MKKKTLKNEKTRGISLLKVEKEKKNNSIQEIMTFRVDKPDNTINKTKI